MAYFRPTPKSRLMGAAAPLGMLVAMIATPAFAQDAPAPAPNTQEDQTASNQDQGDIVVTGTLFRRTDTETPSPVTTLTSDNLDKRGLTTIADAVNSISAGNGGGVPQNFTGAFASGATAISLRGLTTNSTLTLFDGLRPAYYPLADDGQRSIVDLNTIPSAIVERVEVLKDGASATYGADAIAGVVNVIMKKEIQGVEGRAEAGISQRGDADNQRLQLTAGFGDLEEKGFNFYISGEYQHSGAVFNRDRGFPYNTNNLSSIDAGGGFTGRNGNVFFVPPASSSSTGATVAIVQPGTPTANSNGLPFATAVSGGLFQTLGSCARDNLITHTNGSGTYCEQDLINTYGVIQPEQTHFGGTARLTANLNSKTQAYLTLNFYQSKVDIAQQPSSIRSNGNPLETRGIALPAVLSNGQQNPQNPFAAQGLSAIIYYRFGDIPSNLTNLSRSYRVAGGIDGSFGADDSWNYSVAATYMRTDLEQTRRGFLYVPGLVKAINDGTYNFINPSLNTQAIRDQISPTLQSRANSELWQVQGTITKELFQLPGGPLQLGVGGQVRYEAVYDPNVVPNRDFITVNPFSAIGNRYVEAAFFELQAPILDQLEANISGRFDHYSIGMSHFSPKVGLKFKPIPQLAIRGTYSEGFRAPSIPETSGSVIGFTQYAPGTGLTAAQLTQLQSRYDNNSYITAIYGLGNNSTGNPDIKPETSRSFTGGVVFSPKSWLSLTVDYYNIRKKNLILSTSLNPATVASNYLLTGDIPAGVTLTLNPVDPAHPNERATPLSVNFLYKNGNSLQTSGIDFELQAAVPLGGGVKWNSNLSATEIFEYNIDNGTGLIQKFVGTLASYNVTSASGTPRWRASWQNTLEIGDFSLTGTGYFVSGYKGWADDNTDPPGDCSKAIETSAQYGFDQNGVPTTTAGAALQCTVRHWIDVDLNAAYKINDNFTFYINVVNLLDAKAPFDPNTYGGNNYNPAWSSAGVIGRLFRAGATFKF